MKRTLTLLIIALLTGCLSQSRADATKPDTVTEQLKQIEQRLIKAAVEMDIDT
jgi:outer membrane biogenesis lipoprotein LolB